MHHGLHATQAAKDIMLNRGHVDCRLTPCWLECSGEFAAAFPTGSVLHDLRATQVAKENMRTGSKRNHVHTSSIRKNVPCHL